MADQPRQNKGIDELRGKQPDSGNQASETPERKTPTAQPAPAPQSPPTQPAKPRQPEHRPDAARAVTPPPAARPAPTAPPKSPGQPSPRPSDPVGGKPASPKQSPDKPKASEKPQPNQGGALANENAPDLAASSAQRPKQKSDAGQLDDFFDNFMGGSAVPPSSGSRRPPNRPDEPQPEGEDDDENEDEDNEEKDEEQEGEAEAAQQEQDQPKDDKGGEDEKKDDASGPEEELAGVSSLLSRLNPLNWAGLVALGLAIIFFLAIMGIAGSGSGGSNSSAEADTGGIGQGSADAQELLDNKRVEIYPSGRTDLETGQIAPVVIRMLSALSEKYKLTITSLKAGHSQYSSSGNVSDHWSGHAVDIAAVNDKPCVSTGKDDCRALAEDVAKSFRDENPQVIFNGFDPKLPRGLNCVGGAAGAVCSDHNDHVHVGFPS